MDPGEKLPECLRNLGVLLLIFFLLFEKLPTNQIEKRCVRLHCSSGLLKTNLMPLEACSGTDHGFVVIVGFFSCLLTQPLLGSTGV